MKQITSNESYYIRRATFISNQSQSIEKKIFISLFVSLHHSTYVQPNVTWHLPGAMFSKKSLKG